MTKAINDQNADRPEYVSLGDVFRRASPGAIATAIESAGIFGWDRYGRWKQFDVASEDVKRALDAVASVYDYESSPERSFCDEPHPMDANAGSPDDPFSNYGWPTGSLPKFSEELTPHSPRRPERSSDITKKRNTLLVIIAGLMLEDRTDVKVEDWRAHGAKARVRKAVEGFGMGVTIDDDTVGRVFDEIDDAIERRQK